MSEVKAFDPYISTTVVGTVAAMAERKLGGFIQRCDYDKLTEQNKMLREALSLVVDKIPMNQNIYGGGYMLLLSHDDCRILRETLNIIELN